MTRPVIFYWQRKISMKNPNILRIKIENQLRIFLQNLPLDPPLDFLQGIVFSNILSLALSSQNLLTILSFDITLVLDNKLMEINCTLNNLESFLFLDLRISSEKYFLQKLSKRGTLQSRTFFSTKLSFYI